MYFPPVKRLNFHTSSYNSNFLSVEPAFAKKINFTSIYNRSSQNKNKKLWFISTVKALRKQKIGKEEGIKHSFQKY